MSEVQDLKNYIMALDSKINNVLLIIQGFYKSNENVNEVVNLIHNLGLERSKQNNILFETIYPDLINRINKIENFQKEQPEKKIQIKIENEYHKEILSIPVEKINFKKRKTWRFLLSKGIKDIGSILEHHESDFLRMDNFGKRTLMDLKETLLKFNVKLKS